MSAKELLCVYICIIRRKSQIVVIIHKSKATEKSSKNNHTMCRAPFLICTKESYKSEGGMHLTKNFRRCCDVFKFRFCALFLIWRGARRAAGSSTLIAL